MRPKGSRLGTEANAAARLLAATLLLFAQILGATLAGASLALPTRLELCVGSGSPLLAALPDEEAPPGHRHDLCPGCLACPGKSPFPSLAAVPLPGPTVRVEPRRPAAEPAPPSFERSLRPPGRAPPVVS